MAEVIKDRTEQNKELKEHKEEKRLETIGLET